MFILLHETVALGQIQTRAKLTWLGLPAESNDELNSIFFNLGGVFFGWILSNVTLALGIHWYWTHGVVSSIGFFLVIMINVIYFAFSVVVCGNTRWSLRRRNNIPQVFELADYLMSLFYLPLVVAQLGRHTVDYGQLEAYIFSSTGLFPGVEIPSENNYVQPTIVESEESTMV